ncbi:MAG: hypothetical protein ABR508_10825 [Candidatus Baltobacteraceae bacterium]
MTTEETLKEVMAKLEEALRLARELEQTRPVGGRCRADADA